tara:strand:+ start:198 stop:452 length:255 start_codon:yes stop_codon:yes gene_type:complete
MIKVSMYGRRPVRTESYESLLAKLQMRHPWCEKIDNERYMKSVRNSYIGLHSFRHITKDDIDISSPREFVKSLERLGEAKIYSE